VKKPGEDLNSILTGIVQPKGRVHFSFCPEITEEELHQYDGCTSNEYHRMVASLLDRRINAAYRLYPNNYIAHDLRSGRQTYADHYCAGECQTFLEHMKKISQYDVAEPDILRAIFLGIYANPVVGNQF
jgi:hypothetical protein